MGHLPIPRRYRYYRMPNIRLNLIRKLKERRLFRVAAFERDRLRERVVAGLQRAKAQGITLGRPRRRIDAERIATVAGLPAREAARRLGIRRSTLQRLLAQKPAEPTC
jgi:DNA invertase Pin-like site-specific DNA recombinase